MSNKEQVVILDRGDRIPIQIYKTYCNGCGEEVRSTVADLTGENEIIVDFMDGMEFECNKCNTITYLQIRIRTKGTINNE